MKRTLALILSCIVICLSSVMCVAMAENVYSGKGDDVIELQPFEGMCVYEIEGNKSSRYFGVIPYTEEGDRLSSLVNTTDVYKGIVFDHTQSAALLEVKANDAWKITVRSIDTVDSVQKGETITGTGDSVFLFSDVNGVSKIATISGNKSSRYFGVIPYDSDGNRFSSLVNTTDVYEGNVMVKNNSRIFVVKADDKWSITFK